MRLPFQSRYARLLTAVIALIAIGGTFYWLRTKHNSTSSNSGEQGEFLLVDAGDRTLDGAPALALTFTLPLDARKTYDQYLKVFEMPAPPKPVTRGPFFNEAPQKPQQSVVSVKPEDTSPQDGAVVS